jgi:AraC family transcriptional regulator
MTCAARAESMFKHTEGVELASVTLPRLHLADLHAPNYVSVSSKSITSNGFNQRYLSITFVMEQHLLIKGMVCERCVRLIRREVQQMGLCISNISLGRVSFCLELSLDDQTRLAAFLMDHGFETMSDRNTRLVQQIKQLAHQHLVSDHRIRFSTLLAEELHMNYDSISEIFSASEGITLEKYIIRELLEKVKELLVYSDKSLTEISHLLGYSSINHLSRQFKEMVGVPPSHFRQIQSVKQHISKRIA